MNKPRPFCHRPIYIDEHRELLAEVERRTLHAASVPGGSPSSSRAASVPGGSPAGEPDHRQRLHAVFANAWRPSRKDATGLSGALRYQRSIAIPVLLAILLITAATILITLTLRH